jgi:hypothetical protein
MSVVLERWLSQYGAGELFAKTAAAGAVGLLIRSGDGISSDRRRPGAGMNRVVRVGVPP